MTTITIDLEKQKKAKEYGRIKQWIFLVGLLLAGVYAFAWLIFGWEVDLRMMLQGVSANPWLWVAAFGGIYASVEYLIGLPLVFYKGYFLPRHYWLSNQTMVG